MELEFIKFFNDEKLEYNEFTRQYQLTLNAIREIVGNAFKNDLIAKNRSVLNSANVYSFIYNRGCTANKRYTELIINHTKQGRALIYQCLMYQIMADSQNGYNDIVNQNPIDFGSGSIINREEIRKNKVAVNVEDLVDNSQAYLCGYNVVCQIPYYLPRLNEIIEYYDSSEK